MAMQKQEDWSMSKTNGQPTANYHRVSGQEFLGSDSIRVTVASFFDKDTYDNGGQPYRTRTYVFDYSGMADLGGVIADKTALGATTDVKTELYNAIKADANQEDGFFNSGVTDV